MASSGGAASTTEAAEGSRAATHVQSVARAAALLRAVAACSGSEATAAVLAERVGLNRTTTWRILATLEREGLISHDRRTGTYSLGFGLVDLAREAGGGLVRSSHAVLRRVAAASGETAALAVPQDGVITYVAQAAAGAVVSATWVGREVPLHATSTGKVLLAFSEAREVRSLLRLPRGGRLPRYTPRTITTLARLHEELARTRLHGYAVCRGEFESTAWGVSAPVLDTAGRPTAVLSIWGPGDRLVESRFAELGGLAVSAASELARARVG